MTWGPFGLSAKVAVVTGAAMGIGYAIAARAREAGASVLLVDRDEIAGEDAVSRLGTIDSRSGLSFVAVDVADPGAGEVVFEHCLATLGPPDVLVNNAGIYPISPLAECTEESVDRIIRTNLHGTLFMMKAFAAHVQRHGTGGVIVNLASMEAYHPSFPGMIPYGASKGAVVAMTKHAALELAALGIRVNAIAPGAIVTEGARRTSEGGGLTEEERQSLADAMAQKMPLRRLGEPDDIATVAVFLASPASGYVTGQTLLADGGLLLT